MNIKKKLRGAWRRVRGGVSAADNNKGALAAGAGERRRTQPLPSILNSYSPRSDALPKPTAQNLRRFAETPIARKAINTIKDRIAGMRWRVQVKAGNTRSLDSARQNQPRSAQDDSSKGLATEERVRILTANLEAPNEDDSFRSFAEQVLEDVIVGGFGAAEVQLTGDAARPLALWPVDGATIRMRADWDGRPDSARYVQVTGRFGPEGKIALNDEELMYIRLNPRTHTPFGLGRLEVAFETINEFLGAHRYAARLASNSVVQYALWLKDLSPAHHERLIRWWQDEIEGTGRVPILSVESRPEVLRFGGGTDSDLRLQWQEFLVRVIGCAFDLPPLFLGLERDVNRSTADELSDVAFRSAIVPTARLLAEHITRDVIAKRLGWDDLEFVFCDLESRNELEEAQIQEILLRNGVVSVEEVRRMRGLIG
ncbi:MAG: phage portal protein [Terriglobales bacterium]